MFQQSDLGFGGAGAATLSLDRAIPDVRIPFGRSGLLKSNATRFSIDMLPDLGVDIGSKIWWRGLASCLVLCGVTIALAPGFRTIPDRDATPLTASAWEESRAQGIAPLAWGADSGRRMAATDAVQPLTDTPERPQIDLTATLGEGDSLARALQRAGVGGSEASRVAVMLKDIVDPDAIAPGTALGIALGRRANKFEPRPLQSLSLRARFDMRVHFERRDAELAMHLEPIAIDRTPLRIDGVVGNGLYVAARAAGAPPSAIQTFIRALAAKVSMDNIEASDRFSMVVEQQRAATGEVEYGKLLYIGLERGNRATRMIPWAINGRSSWFDSAGVGQSRGGFAMPVAGAHKTSGFGWRLHPLLGYSRMHQGTDYGAAYGTPIRAVSDGVVNFAGWHGGHGNMIKLSHGGGLGTGYAHMSRMAVSPGTRVNQGQVIGYVGSTGLSTGPHLHFEVYRGGVPVNSSSVSFASTPLLTGAALAAFNARLNAMATFRPAKTRIASR